MRRPGPVLITAIPPATPEPWYAHTRACKGCRAQVLTRIEREDGSAVIRVAHETSCQEAGRGDSGRARPQGRQDADQSPRPASWHPAEKE